ncbi:MAG: ligase-associated DNA damage response endonuclease PdeM [Methyloceanibacter sp.]|jgi:DNA ligase-associated metallophosphoesterase|uniref:ligase-associated DNA damage response endonuclease PdeM n=1 Tax=Methyloceanibacter sp. TaxID=1965321 RepID=UPI002CE685B9|nr:ligase-associated DNA damage response endonuclease PdeM [Methyloceanibacter sp.]
MLRLMSEVLAGRRPPIRLAGHSFLPVAAGALYWESENTLLVADLHLEKGAAFAARGMMLPPYDTRSTLQRLAACLDHFSPRRVVALGDSFHRSELAGRLSADDREELAALQQGRDWYWILGNHDPDLPESIGGFVCRSLMIGGITLCHQPSLSRAPEIAGHLHPVARIARRGEGIRRKCFATDGHRLVMPAFGAYAGGLNVLDEAFSSLFHWHLMQAWLTGRTSVYPLQASLLLPD